MKEEKRFCSHPLKIIRKSWDLWKFALALILTLNLIFILHPPIRKRSESLTSFLLNSQFPKKPIYYYVMVLVSWLNNSIQQALVITQFLIASAKIALAAIPHFIQSWMPALFAVALLNPWWIELHSRIRVPLWLTYPLNHPAALFPIIGGGGWASKPKQPL